MELKFEEYAKIKKSIAEVFDAVYNPKKLSGYFTTGGASAPLEEGITVTWNFADFPGAFPVYGNCMGWSQMLLCLKVYLEYGKNLREFLY